MITHATIRGDYRYTLDRRWAEGPRVVWIMLNPSTADASKDDATIRRCIKFAMNWGYAGIAVVNLFAYRTTYPQKLLTATDPIGKENDAWIGTVLNGDPRDLVVAAWGSLQFLRNSKPLRDRARAVAELVHDCGLEMKCLGQTMSGDPRHPVRLAYDTPLSDLERVA